eukprot:s273_g23.t2
MATGRKDVLTAVPSLQVRNETADVFRAFLRNRLLHIPGSRTPAAAQARQVLQEYLSGIFRHVVVQNWTSETSGASPEAAQEALAISRPPRGQRWYGSFVVDGEAADHLVAALARCGVETNPIDECRATGTAWCFFGANATSSSMQGKPEHVDQLAPGTITVHTQLCGRKVWKLRPHPLCPNWSDGAPLLSASWYGGRLELVCEEGDLLFVDTAAWYHTTEIPPLTDFTFSLAQDFSERLPATGEKLEAALQTQILAGSAAGTIADIITHPLSTIKTRLQVQGSGGGGHGAIAYRGVTHALSHIMRNEGLVTFYRGLGAVLVGAAPAQGLYFGGYETAKTFLGGGQSGVGNFASGICRPTLRGSLAWVPMDVIKERLQVEGQLKVKSAYSGSSMRSGRSCGMSDSSVCGGLTNSRSQNRCFGFEDEGSMMPVIVYRNTFLQEAGMPRALPSIQKLINIMIEALEAANSSRACSRDLKALQAVLAKMPVAALLVGGARLVYDLNPKGLVPVLVDPSGKVTVESEDIVDAIAEKSSKALSAAASPDAVEIRRLINQRLLPAGKQAKMFGQQADLGPVLQALDKLVAGPFMVGDEVTVADISAAPMLQRLFEDGMVPKPNCTDC